MKVEWVKEYEYESDEVEGAVYPRETRRIRTENAEAYTTEMHERAKAMLPPGLKLKSWGRDHFGIFEEDEEECPSTVYSDGDKIVLDFTKSYVVEEFLKKLIKAVFGSVEWEELSPEEKKQRRLEEAKRQRIEKLKSSLSEIDYEILKLRKEGVSLWGIASKLALTISQVYNRLQKVCLIPELAEQIPIKYRPLPREERKRL